MDFQGHTKDRRGKCNCFPVAGPGDDFRIDSDFIRVKYHKDQANEKDYSNEGIGAAIKKFQADKLSNLMDSPEVKEFEADKDAGKEKRRT